MKTTFLLILIVLLVNQVQSQVILTITTDKNAKATVQENKNGDKEKNTLIINNTFDSNKCEVIIRSKQPSTFSFGKGGKVSLKKGGNTFEFNSGGIIDDYGNNKLHLVLPINVTVLDEAGSVIKRDTVNAETEKGTEDSSVINKKDSANGKTTIAVSKDSLTAIPFYDAQYLLKYNEIGIDQFERILNYYANKKGLSGQALIDFYESNDFLKEFVNKAELDLLQKQTASLNFNDLIGKGLSSVGGLDVTKIADAFAKFIVKRTKQELNIAFFDKFKTYISKYPDLQTVFPQTYKALTIIGDEIYNYGAYIQTLRENFENDLSTLDKNLPSIIDNHPDFFKKHPQLAATLNSGCYIADALDDKVHPGDILRDLPTDDKYWNNNRMKNWKGTIQTLQLFSASLRDTAANTDSVYWVSIKQVKELTANQTAFKIYLGLIYQEAKNKYDSIHYSIRGQDKTLIEFLKQLADSNFDNDYTSYKDFVTHFSEKADKLNKMIKNYRKPANDSLAFEQYYNYFNSSIDLIQQCTDISKLPYVKDVLPNLADTLKDYFDVAHSTANLVLDIRRKNYASAAVNAVHVYDVVKAKYTSKESVALTKKEIKKIDRQLSRQLKDTIQKAGSDRSIAVTANDIYMMRQAKMDSAINKNTNKTIKIRDAKAIAQELILKAGENDTTIFINSASISVASNSLQGKMADDTLRKFYKYATFMATIVQAKSSDDIEEAIEAFALPQGSSRIKRESPFNVSLNAYAGLYTGNEIINGLDKNKSIFHFNSFGVTAPIGLTISRGHSFFFFGTGQRGWQTGKKGWSTSLFVSLVDIGALAAFRFNNDTTKINNSDSVATSQAPSIKLKNIVSPGAFLSIGIPKSPLSVNFGVQLGPNLRNVTSTNNTTSLDFSNTAYWRYSISLCVDIPVLNFYTKSK